MPGLLISGVGTRHSLSPPEEGPVGANSCLTHPLKRISEIVSESQVAAKQPRLYPKTPKETYIGLPQEEKSIVALLTLQGESSIEEYQPSRLKKSAEENDFNLPNINLPAFTDISGRNNTTSIETAKHDDDSITAIHTTQVAKDLQPYTNSKGSLLDIIESADLTGPLPVASSPPSKQGRPLKKGVRKVAAKRTVGTRRSIRIWKGYRRMLNGYGNSDGRKSSTDESPSSDMNSIPPIATLGNIGNTCFLNSVLYTLRFTPNFVHNLHHLVSDLNEFSSKQVQLKSKTSSLGRNVSSGKSWTSTKEMLCISQANVDNSKSKLQKTTEKLHSLFEALHASEMKESCEPFQAEDYLKSLREVNSFFDGNQQHDAHELLVCLLNIVHEASVELEKLKFESQQEEQGTLSKDLEVPGNHPPTMNNSKTWGGVRKSWKRKKDKHVTAAIDLSDSKLGADASGHVKVADCENADTGNGIIIHMPLAAIEEDSQNSMVSQESCPSPKETDVGLHSVDSFIVRDFQGITILNTTCLECECTSLRKEVFSDIGVCVTTERKDDDGNMSDDSSCPKTMSEVYESAIVTTEYLRDLNKYWCLTCTRYNEAKRSVQYETLPKLLILQLKRFASSINSTTKVNEHMPTPLTLACFCTQCCILPEEKRLHKYQLYSVVMHLGPAIASGHYISYVRASDQICTYQNCQRDKNKSSSVSANSSSKSGSCDKVGGFFRFFKTKSNPESSTKSTNCQSYSYSDCCQGLDCCGVRLNRSLLEQINNGTFSSKRKESKVTSTTGEEVDTSVPEPVWLECDDENVRPLTVREFEEILAAKSSRNSGQTPYLLFYSRCE